MHRVVQMLVTESETGRRFVEGVGGGSMREAVVANAADIAVLPGGGSISGEVLAEGVCVHV